MKSAKTSGAPVGRISVATSLSHGDEPYPEHAARAVKQALEKAGIKRANSVLLLLTPEFAPDPSQAIRAAAGAAGCMQVIGCTGAGVLTDQEWILDSPAAAAMVFGGDIHLDLTPNRNDDELDILSFCTPAGMSSDWLDIPAARIGAVSGDIFGQGPFKVWYNSRIAEEGQAEASLQGVTGTIAVSQGVRALTSPIEVGEVAGFDVLKMGSYPALNVLVQSLPKNIRKKKTLPFHLLTGGFTFGDPETAIREGRYRLSHIVSANLSDRSITLSDKPRSGERLFWGMRDALVAERDIKQTITSTGRRLGGEPDFAFLFPCMGRGPHFFGNRDRDLDQLKSRYPGLPIIGFYGNGEIGPLDNANHLYQYSTILGLYKAH